MPTGLFRRFAIFGLILALAALVACQPGIQQPEPDTVSEPVITDADITALITQSNNSQSPQKEYYLLDAARLLHQQGNLVWARNLLNSVNSQVLETNRFIEYTLLFSQIAWEDDAYFLTQRILTNPRLERQWQDFPPADQITLLKRRADLFSLLGETRPSVMDRLSLQGLLPSDEEQTANHEALWQTLMTLPLAELQTLSTSASTAEQRGWYELATISKSNQSNLERQLALIHAWARRSPEHPASLRLPNDLQLLERLIEERPQQLAILLPQHGRVEKAAEAIRDGFMASFYQAAAEGINVPVVRFYDTADSDIEAVYEQAMRDGAEMIIGPLDKDNVTRLSQFESLPVPTLAVNYTEGKTDQPVAANLFQFGLAVEDEARQAAQRAWLEGYRHPMILTTDASWGQRSAEAFIAAWTELGGTVTANRSFSGQRDYSNVIETAMLIDESHNRANALRRLFGEALEFEPRRRQDIDMIFLVATPTQARQVKPTLDFHYASGLPVFATSHVYSGERDAKLDRDLNDIKFSTLPWNFSNSQVRRTIDSASKPTAAYQQLYALGVDAYQLYPRLRQLQEVPNARFYGMTGSLQLRDNRIERQQIWAQMRNGVPVQLPTELTN